MKKIIKKYQLFYISETQIGDTKIEVLEKRKDYSSYGGYSARDDIFDTEEQALEYAINSGDWMWRRFTILPIYSVDHHA